MAQLLDTALFNDANLQEYYTLEDANADKNGNNLTNNNTVTFNAAKYNNGADGGSSDGNKSLSVASNLGFGGGDYSISLWVKLNTEIASGLYYFCEIVDATTHNAVILQYDYNGGTRQLSVIRVRLSVAADTGTPHNVDLGTSTIHHIVWTYNDSSNTMKLYLNNVEVQSFSSSGNGSSGGTSGFHILEGRTANDNSTLGIIDDVGLFNKTLSTDEINTLFSDGTDYTEEFNETISLSEVFARAFTRTNSENISLSETFIKSPSRTLSETISLSEVFSLIHGYFRTLSDNTTLSEVFNKAITKIYTESAITLSEVFTTTKNHFISLTDSISVATRFILRKRRYSQMTKVEPEETDWTRVS